MEMEQFYTILLPKFTCFSGVAQAKHRPEVSGLGLVGTNQRDTSE
jgi:hypothetical protein